MLAILSIFFLSGSGLAMTGPLVSTVVRLGNVVYYYMHSTPLASLACLARPWLFPDALAFFQSVRADSVSANRNRPA
jgi:hypothetical protein